MLGLEQAATVSVKCSTFLFSLSLLVRSKKWGLNIFFNKSDQNCGICVYGKGTFMKRRACVLICVLMDSCVHSVLVRLEVVRYFWCVCVCVRACVRVCMCMCFLLVCIVYFCPPSLSFYSSMEGWILQIIFVRFTRLRLDGFEDRGVAAKTRILSRFLLMTSTLSIWVPLNTLVQYLVSYVIISSNDWSLYLQTTIHCFWRCDSFQIWSLERFYALSDAIFHDGLSRTNYLRQGGYVFGRVC